MLHTLDLRGFRGFESYRLAGLARVNLLVGKNNCGKTSILEAVELLVSEGDPEVLNDSLQRRGQHADRVPGMLAKRIDVSHLFYGHTCTPDVSFDLSSDKGKRILKVKILSLDDMDKKAGDLRRAVREQMSLLDLDEEDLDLDEEDPTPTPAFAMSIDRGGPARKIVLPVMEDGAVVMGYKSYRRFARNVHSGTPAHFLTLDGFDPASMDKMWNTVLEEGIEEEIVADMRLLESNLDSIQFRSSPGLGGRILIGLQNVRGRLPISTYGDGMKRLLALRLSFIGTKDGVLLIDEIDTGLHWTVMEEMWQFVMEVAKRLNVQVFATTHSYDCIRGLGSLIRNRPDLEDQVSIQKIDRLLPEAVCLQSDQIRVAVENDIEVR